MRTELYHAVKILKHDQLVQNTLIKSLGEHLTCWPKVIKAKR